MHERVSVGQYEVQTRQARHPRSCLRLGEYNETSAVCKRPFLYHTHGFQPFMVCGVGALE